MADLVSLFQKVKPGVVAIIRRFGNGPVDQHVVGTGFNVDPKGVIVTCTHVIREALKDTPFVEAGPGVERAEGDISFLQAVLIWPERGGKPIRVERRRIVLGREVGEHDVTICRLDPAPYDFPFLRLGDGQRVTEGTPVGACGYPLGLVLQRGNPHHVSSIFQTGTVGSVVPYSGTQPDRRIEYVLDMGMNPGNSGGPVFLQKDGCVIGIVRATPMQWDEVRDQAGEPLRDENGKPAKLIYRMPTGLTYAIPIDLVLAEIEKVRRLANDEVMAVRAGRQPEWWGAAEPR